MMLSKNIKLLWAIPPILMFLLMMSMAIVGQKNAGFGLDFVEEEAYRHMTVAQTVISIGSYGTPGNTAMPAGSDFLWHVLLAIAGKITGDCHSAAYLLGAFFSVLTLVFVGSFAGRLMEDTWFSLFIGLALAVSPVLIPACLSGKGTPISMFLLAMACLEYLEVVVAEDDPLPLTPAWLFGLSMWLHLEFFLFWPLLCLFAVFYEMHKGRLKERSTLILVRAISGFLIMLLTIFPLIAWNMRVIGVPWPRVPEAPLYVIPGLTRIQDVFGAGLPYVLDGMVEGLKKTVGLLFFEDWPMRALFIGGFIMALRLLKKNIPGLKATISFFLLLGLAPMLCGLFYPLTGPEGLNQVTLSLAPLLVIAICWLVCDPPLVPRYIAWMKFSEADAKRVRRVWMVGLFSIVLLVCMASTVRTLLLRKDNLRQVTTVRSSIEEMFSQNLLYEGMVLTDQPGWLGYSQVVGVLDLTGHATVRILADLNDEGLLEEKDFRAFWNEKRVSAVIVWDPYYRRIAGSLPGGKSVSSSASETIGPKVMVKKSSAGS